MKISKEKLGKLQDDKVEKKNRSPQEIYDIAYGCYQSGQYTDAEKFFRLLTVLEIGKSRPWMGLAAALQMQKKYGEAVECYGAAALLDKDKSNPFPHAYAASCLYLLGDLSRAKKALKSAKEISRENNDHADVFRHLLLLEKQWF